MADYTVSVRLQAIDNASQAIAQVNQQLQGMGEKRKNSDPDPNSKNAWDQYAGAIMGAVAAYGVMRIAGEALQLVDTGEKVHSVRMAFEALADSPLEAAANLETLRVATRGILSDVELMSTSNRLGSMGLADTADEMGELIHMATALGGVMSPGSTAAQNIDNFTLMLANNSRLRLDTFGISSARVKERMDELKEAGMGLNEAFVTATLEEGRRSLENLGEAADAGATSVDVLSARWRTFFDEFAEGAATIGNDLADTFTTIESSLGSYADFLTHDSQDAAAEAARAAEIAAANTNHGQIVGGGNEILFGDAAVDNTVYSSSTRAADDRAAIQAQMEYEANAAAALAISLEQKQAQLDILTATSEWGDRVLIGAERMGEAHIQAVGVRNAMTSSLGEMDFEVFDGMGLSEDLVAARAESAARIFSSAWNEALNAYGLDFSASTTEAAGIETNRGVRNGQQLFTQEEADAIQTAADYYNDLLSDAQQLHEAGLITDAELANVSSTADQAARLADNAQRGAEAFANMNLATALGQTSGGMGGEMNADVLAYMQNSGQFSESQIAEYQRGLELGTGQQTQASINYDDVIVPMIADIINEYGVEAGAAAIANMQSGMSTAAIAGMTDEQIAAAQAGMTGYSYQAIGTLGMGSGAGGAMTSEDKTMGGLSIVEQESFDIDAYMQSTIQINQDWQSIDSSTKTVADNITAAGAAMDPMLAQVSTFRQQWTSLNGQRVRLTADIAVNVSNEGVFRDMIMEVVRQNAGAVPGEGAPGGGGGGGGSGGSGGRPR
jgi:hypothetical protein